VATAYRAINKTHYLPNCRNLFIINMKHMAHKSLKLIF